MSHVLKISVASRQYVKVPISAIVDGDVDDPTGDVVQMAFVTIGEDPVDGDWQDASWETSSGTFWARCLVGPDGAVELAKGRYQIYVKVTDQVEIPVLESDVLEVI